MSLGPEKTWRLQTQIWKSPLYQKCQILEAPIYKDHEKKEGLELSSEKDDKEGVAEEAEKPNKHCISDSKKRTEINKSRQGFMGNKTWRILLVQS